MSHRSRDRDRRPPGRRVPPPPHTGLEQHYFESAQQSSTPLVITLADGRKISGAVQEFDRNQIVVEDSSGPLAIRKSDIRYISEEE